MKQVTLIILLFSTLLSCSSPEAIFIDDVVQSKDDLEKLDTSEIFSYTKYGPGEEGAPEHYYKGTDTTVIVIKTKKVETRLQQQRYTLLTRILDSVDNGADILIILDGILISPDAQMQLRALSSHQLSKVDTMEWNAAKELFGSQARPITLIINMYNPENIYTLNR